MGDLTITLEQTGTKGRYVAVAPGVTKPAELHFSKAGPTLVIASRTDVPEAMRGMGVGRSLVERLIADARTEGFRIVPLCPFVKAQYARHPEWSDVMRE